MGRKVLKYLGAAGAILALISYAAISQPTRIWRFGVAGQDTTNVGPGATVSFTPGNGMKLELDELSLNIRADSVYVSNATKDSLNQLREEMSDSSRAASHDTSIDIRSDLLGAISDSARHAAHDTSLDIRSDLTSAMSDTARQAAHDTSLDIRSDLASAMSDTSRSAVHDSASTLRSYARQTASDTSRVAAHDTAEVLRNEMPLAGAWGDTARSVVHDTAGILRSEMAQVASDTVYQVLGDSLYALRSAIRDTTASVLDDSIWSQDLTIQNNWWFLDGLGVTAAGPQGIYVPNPNPYTLIVNGRVLVLGKVSADSFSGNGALLSGVIHDTTGLRTSWRGDISDSLATIVPIDTSGMREEWRVDISDTANVLRSDWLESISDSLASIVPVDTTGVRAEWRVDISDTANVLRDDWLESISDSLASIVQVDTSGMRAEWRVDISDSLVGFVPGDWGDTSRAVAHDTANVLRDEWLESISDSLLSIVPIDTAGMRDEWRVDISDTSNVLRGEWLESISDSLAGFVSGEWGDTSRTVAHDTAEVLRDEWLVSISDSLAEISGGDTTGLRDEWRVDISDSLAGFEGGGGVTTEALHDTADNVRSEIVQSQAWNTFRRIVSQTPGSYLTENDRYNNGAIVRGVYSDPTNHFLYAALGNSGMLVFSVDPGDGTLSLTDSISTPSGDVWGDGTSIFTGDAESGMSRMYTTSEGGELAVVDSFGSIGPTTSIYGSGGLVFAFKQWGPYNLYFTPMRRNPEDPNDLEELSGSTGLYLPPYTFTMSGSDVFTASGAGYYGDYALQGQYVNNPNTGALTIGTSVASPDTVYGVCANSMYVIGAMKNEGAVSFRRGTLATFTSRDTLSVDYTPTAIVCDETHVFIGTTGGFTAASIDTAGHMTQTDQITYPQSSPRLPYDGGHPMYWDGLYLYIGTDGYGLVQYVATDQSIPTYAIQARFADTTLVQGPLTIDLDPAAVVGTHDFTVKNSGTGAYAWVMAGDAAWTASSSQRLKELGPSFTRDQGRKVLNSISRLPIYSWQWRKGDQRQHVGAMAEDWTEIAKQLSLGPVDSSQIDGSQQIVALILSVQELERENDRQWAAILALALCIAGLIFWLRYTKR